MIDFRGIASKDLEAVATFGQKSGFLKDTLNMDYDDLIKMKKEDLKKVNQKLNAEMNRRIRRLEKSKYKNDSPAFKNLKERGKPKRKAGMTLNQERNFFIEVRNFMLNKTSTVAGTKDLDRYYRNKFGKSYTNLSDAAKSDFWELYNKYTELNPGIFLMKGGTNTPQKEAYEIFKKNYGKVDVDILEGMIRAKLDKYYNDNMGF